MKTALFTICAKNYLPLARTLLDSVARHHPDFDCFVILSDEVDGALDPGSEKFSVIEPRELAIPELADMALRYNITEFSTAIKPAAFSHLFSKEQFESVIYLDPDIYVVSPMEELVQLLDEGVEAVLTPHICSPVEDGKKPDDQSILQAGLYNLGFLALKDAPETRSFLAWWYRRLLRDCRIDLAEGLFVDQKWAELLPSFVGATEILRHPGYNVAYWNLMNRHVEKGADGWQSGGKALRFFHFSGANFEKKEVFSKHQDRFSYSNIGDLALLLDEYRKEVDSNGREKMSGLPYAYDFLSNGIRIPEVLRRIYREDYEPADTDPGELHESVLAYCNDPSPRVAQDAGLPVTNLMMKIWSSRPDLQEAFNLGLEDARKGFVGWYAHSATRELELDPIFSPRNPEVDSSPSSTGERSGAPGPKATETPAGFFARVARWILVQAYRFKPLYMRVSQERRHAIKVFLMKSAYSPGTGHGVETGTPNPADATGSEDRVGAQLIGYPRAELGMGEHVRLSAKALDSVGFPFSIYDFSVNVVARQQDDRAVKWLSTDSSYPVNIFHINADQMTIAGEALGPAFFENRYNIGYWAWELSRFPREWDPAIAMVDEIWTPSRFIRDAIIDRTEKPVHWMPLAVHVTPPPHVDRAFFHLPEDVFLFLFSFDFASFRSRKNPEAIIEAFVAAFPEGTEPVALVIKTLAHEHYAEELAFLKRLAASDPRIRVMDIVLSHEEIAGLTNVCDCYVSLHRSEGFGRGMAEAMHLGKPVIATGYSGNVDFMTPATSCLVDYSLVPVKDGEYPHSEGQVWAEPDVAQAAEYMRRLSTERPYAANLGREARRHLVSKFSTEAVGHRIRKRLFELGVF